MSKIFRLHTGASDNIEDWGLSSHLSEHMVDSISDPNGGMLARQVTSIPTPFARMDLMRTAFRQVTTSGKIDGLSIYHRMVSECLDVAEVFFNSDALKDQLEIISWDAGISYNGTEMIIDPHSDLGRLIQAQHPGHKLLGETLFLYIKQDTSAFNFDKLQRVYLLNYHKGGKGLMNIIGGTSPLTMFFSSPNNMKGIVDLNFGAGYLFDGNCTPLYKRDPDFINYLYSIKDFFPEFASRFGELNEYLELTFQVLPEDMKYSIRKMDRSFAEDEYQDIPLDGAGFFVEVLGTRLKANKPQPQKVERSSEFVIAATRKTGEPLPLVLPNTDYNEPLRYVKDLWKSSFRAPLSDPRPLQERTLPHLSYIRYPYLTLGDLLEDTIIRLPYPVNKEKYFNGNLSGAELGFALPLKKEFFKYFSVADLRNRHQDGKRWFELIGRPDGTVEAIVRIPIRNNRYISFRRIYQERSMTAGSRSGGQGYITDGFLSITTYPFLKTGRPDGQYRIYFLEADAEEQEVHHDFALHFYDGRSMAELPVSCVRERANRKESGMTARCYSLQKEFDFIELKQQNGIKGLMIPLFETLPSGAAEFVFAVDFGTTNTHIEYRVDKSAPAPFEITERDMQVGCSVADDVESIRALQNHKSGAKLEMLKELVPVDFLPSLIGRNANYRFPTRTAVAGRKLLDVNQPTYALADYIIPFAYEKASSPEHIKVTPNLKWTDFRNDPEKKRCAEAFIEEVLLLIRNKVLLNGGSLDATTIIWFYPSSMSEYNRNMLEHTWHSLAQRYISSSVNVLKMSESIAPFYYFRNKEGVLAYEKPVVNIDIGGGTTDVVIYKNNLPVCSTSFRFAANSVFGDGYGNSPLVNGFIQKYYPIIREKLISNELYHLVSVMEQIRASDSSEEMIAFFFSLEHNRTIEEGHYPISFSAALRQDEDFKLVLLFFYAAIIYHIATLMKAKGMQPPRYLLFSGMGSKVINLVDTNISLKNLQEYTNLIFRDMYRVKELNIELRQYGEPKEITCKGGLLCDQFVDTDNIRSVFLGGVPPVFVEENPVRYAEVENRELLDSVAGEVSMFVEKFFAGDHVFGYAKKFGVNPASLTAERSGWKEDLMQYLIAGVKGRLAEEQDNMQQPLEETLFFYPLRGIIHRMAQHGNRTRKTGERIWT